jgi:hypothetical protein
MEPLKDELELRLCRERSSARILCRRSGTGDEEDPLGMPTPVSATETSTPSSV